MATLTKAEVAQRVLEVLGVLGAGQSPSSMDQNRVEERVQSVYESLELRGKAPYEISAVPEWAQADLIDFIAPRCATLFRVGPQHLQSLALQAQIASKSIDRQTRSPRQNVRQEVRPY